MDGVLGLPSLQTILPATYRPIVVICIGIWGWAFSLLILIKSHMDPASILQIHPDKNVNLHNPIFAIASVLTCIIAINLWFCYHYGTPSSWFPLITYLAAFIMILWPGKGFYRKERSRFLRVLRRLFSFNIFAPVFFSDIILADILTSLSNVFGDLFTTLCVILAGQDATLEKTQVDYHRDLFLPILISIPYFIRLRQCTSEYLDSNCKTKRHLFNALKYASAFPVILLSATQKRAAMYVAETGSVPKSWWIGETNIFRLWMAFVFFNSMYSFWWDVSMDWNLVHITQSGSGGKLGSVLSVPIVRVRRHLHFSQPLYFLASIIDFLLRTTWSMKLSSHLFVKKLENSIFLVELLEVIRRWIWVIFRMESEWVKRNQIGLPTHRNDNEPIRMDMLDRGKLTPISEEDDVEDL
ncbi:EXS family-domain-containing protein [Phycomyces nitens]|nr:EXS family-domain-containing protein [Phycomyces nitens]